MRPRCACRCAVTAGLTSSGYARMAASTGSPARAEFPTTGEWQTVQLSFDQFIPVFRGRLVPQAGPVVPAAIRQVGFMLADKNPGPFALEIRSIEFVD